MQKDLQLNFTYLKPIFFSLIRYSMLWN